MCDTRSRLLAELANLRERAEEVGRQLRELDQQDRRSRFRVLPGGAVDSPCRESSSTVAVASTPVLLVIPADAPPSTATPSRIPVDIDETLRVGLGIDQFPKKTV